MDSNNIKNIISRAKKQVPEYMNGYTDTINTKFNAFLAIQQTESGLLFLQEELEEALKMFRLVIKTFPQCLVTEDIITDNVFKDDHFYKWYEAFKFIERDQSFSLVFTFDPDQYLDVFKLERQEYEENFNYILTDSLLFFSEVLIIVASYFLFRKEQIRFLETKIRELQSDRPGPGLNCTFSDEEKIKLYEGCIAQKLIDPNTSKDNFIKALSPNEYPSEKIRWIAVNRDGNLKSVSLACFYYTVVPTSKDKDGNYTLDRPAILRCFSNKDGNSFKLDTPKKTQTYFEYWMRKFRAMLHG